MKKTVLIIVGVVILAAPAYAWHGPMASTQRDAWIDESLARLAVSGYLPSQPGGTKGLTNLEAAELTAQASEVLLAQAKPAAGTDPAASPAGDVDKLIVEFKDELAKMEVDIEAVRMRIDAIDPHLASFRSKQDDMKKRTGSEMGLFGRGWMVTDRGFGPDSGKVPLSRLAVNFTETRFRSVPVPDLLFEFYMRIWYTYGMQFGDPLSNKLEVRRVTLTNTNEVAVVKIGDFYKNYTPLTLYNDDPWHARLKPTHHRQWFSDIEELSLTDQGPSWHMRGLSIRTREKWPDHPILKSAVLDVIGGNIKPAGTLYAGFYAGTQADLSFLDDQFGLQGTGLLLWDDPASASVTYQPAAQFTWVQKQRIVSAAPRVKLELPAEMVLEGSFELASSRYQDDLRNADRTFEDWATRGVASLELSGVRLQGKALNVGPRFYSPGAQTLRRTPSGNMPGYLTNDEKRDFGVIGSRNRDLFQGVGRPSFAPYDRREDNLFPYGDATPNREGIVAGLSAELGFKGWLKPGAFYTKANEVEPNLVIVPGIAPAPNLLRAVDSGEYATVAQARDFSGLEGLITLDVARALDRKDRLAAGFDYRNQETSLSTLSEDLSFKTDTWMATADFVLPVKWMRWADMSLLYGQRKTTGREYVDPDGLAAYPFYYWSEPTLDTYSLRDFDESTVFWAYNVKYTLSKNAALLSSIYHEQTKEHQRPDVDSRRLEWRVGYEFSI